MMPSTPKSILGGWRYHEQNRNVAIRFAEQNIRNSGLFCSHAASHGRIGSVTGGTESGDAVR